MRGIGKHITTLIKVRANRDFRAGVFRDRETALLHHVGTVERDISAIRSGRRPGRHLTPDARGLFRQLVGEVRGFRVDANGCLRGVKKIRLQPAA